jgi:hypothetical protein
MKNKILFIFLLGIVSFSCEDFITEKPFDRVTNDLVLSSPQDVEQLVLGMYEDGLQDTDSYGEKEIGVPGLLSDELVHTGSFPTNIEFDRNSVSAQNTDIFNYWDALYEGIFMANFVIKNIDVVTFTDATFKNQLLGEAKWGRALYHFNLLRMFGDVPIANTPDLATLSSLERSPKAEVLAFVVSDLEEAITLIPATFSSKTRATQWAAKALLARVQLFAGNKSAAGDIANDVIENGPYNLDNNYLNIFNGSSSETIFEVFFSTIDGGGSAFFFQEGRYEYAPSPQLISAYEEGDVRLGVIGANKAGLPMGIKYKDIQNGSDRPIVLRLAEMHLIRAEARVGTEQSLADLNLIRDRAGLAPKASVNIDDILQERFVEFSFEGQRWYDLVRTGKATVVMSALNPATWQDTDVLLPIPQNERNQNPKLTQNPGY